MPASSMRHTSDGRTKVPPVCQDQDPSLLSSYATSGQVTSKLRLKSHWVLYKSVYHTLCASLNSREVKSGLFRKHSRISFPLLLKLWKNMSCSLSSSLTHCLKLKRRIKSSESVASELNVECQGGERVMEREGNREVY